MVAAAGHVEAPFVQAVFVAFVETVPARRIGALLEHRRSGDDLDDRGGGIDALDGQHVRSGRGIGQEATDMCWNCIVGPGLKHTPLQPAGPLVCPGAAGWRGAAGASGHSNPSGIPSRSLCPPTAQVAGLVYHLGHNHAHIQARRPTRRCVRSDNGLHIGCGVFPMGLAHNRARTPRSGIRCGRPKDRRIRMVHHVCSLLVLVS